MMKKLFFLPIFVCFCQTINAQLEPGCATPSMDSISFMNLSWVGNNQTLLNYLDSIGYGAQMSIQGSPGVEGGFDMNTIYWVPVKAWVYNDDNGDGGINQAEVELSIRNLNLRFSGQFNDYNQAHPHSMIQFYIDNCDISFINNSTYAFYPNDNHPNKQTPSTLDYMWNTYYEAGMLNIHYVQEHNFAKARLPGRYLANLETESFVCMVPTSTNRSVPTQWPEPPFITSVLAHEVGHALGLSHTHDGRKTISGKNEDANNCRQESVSRTRTQNIPPCVGWSSGTLKCEVNGDGFCDTEADPYLRGRVQETPPNSGIYVYNYNGTDNWNDTWNPNIYNIMSYSRTILLEYFSPLQIGAMHSWILGNESGIYKP